MVHTASQVLTPPTSMASPKTFPSTWKMINGINAA